MSIRLLTASAVALGLVAFAPVANAQDAATVDQAIVVRDAAMRSNIAMDYVTQLTTRFGARPAGSRSEQQAAAWAAEMRRQLSHCPQGSGCASLCSAWRSICQRHPPESA